MQQDKTSLLRKQSRAFHNAGHEPKPCDANEILRNGGAAALRGALDGAASIGELPKLDDINNDVATEIQRLSGLSTIQYERERKVAADRLGMRASALDAAVKAARPQDSKGQGRSPSIADAEPAEVAGKSRQGPRRSGCAVLVLFDPAGRRCGKNGAVVIRDALFRVLPYIPASCGDSGRQGMRKVPRASRSQSDQRQGSHPDQRQHRSTLSHHIEPSAVDLS